MALDEDSSVEKFDRLLEEGNTDESLYCIKYASGVGDICSAMFSNTGTILEAPCSASHWTFRLLFPERNVLSETVEELEEQGIQVDVK